jgi:hypothetical protein
MRFLTILLIVQFLAIPVLHHIRSTQFHSTLFACQESITVNNFRMIALLAWVTGEKEDGICWPNCQLWNRCGYYYVQTLGIEVEPKISIYAFLSHHTLENNGNPKTVTRKQTQKING